MKVIVFTSDENNGGIQQFTYQLVDSLIILGIDTILFIPDDKKVIVPLRFKSLAVRYKKTKTINKNDIRLQPIIDHIVQIDPSIILYSDNSMCSMQTMCRLPNNIKKAYFIHDVTPHPGFFRLRPFLISLLGKQLSPKTFKKTNHIILLSQNSVQKFESRYPKYKKKVLYLPLGAHVPKDSEFIPKEISKVDKPYYLFFGRLDKYKGIYRLLEAYKNIKMSSDDLPMLIIAGNGNLTNHEIEEIKHNHNIILIKRYLENGEMLWLIKNALTVVLPYVEASQSGVLPIAYHFGIPVIASNIPGLSEYVEDQKTGYLFNTVEELMTIMVDICETNLRSEMRNNIEDYYNKKLNWEINLNKLINTILGSLLE